MPPRKREPWWHANKGWLVALLIALASGWANDRWRAAGNDRLLQVMPERRDRDIDDLRARIAALEARCQ